MSLIAQLIEHCTGSAGVMGLNPFNTVFLFHFLLAIVKVVYITAMASHLLIIQSHS